EWWHVTDWHPENWHRPDPGPDAANPRLSHGSGGLCQQFSVDDARHRLGLATGRPFTTNMVAAVKAFQFAHRIPRSGVIDGRTWAALRGVTRSTHHTGIL